MSFLACPGIRGDCLIKSGMTLKYSLFLHRINVIPGLTRNPGGMPKNSWMPDQVRHDTVEVFFVPYTESMSFLACPGIQGDCQRTPGCLIKSGMTQLKFSLFRTRINVIPGLPRNPGGLPKNWMPDQVRHDTVEVFFVPYTESMSFLACPGIQGDCQRTPGCLIKSGMTQLKYSLFRTQNQCHSWRRPGIQGDCLIKSGMTQLKYSLFRTQNQCHSWLAQESRGHAKELLDA